MTEEIKIWAIDDKNAALRLESKAQVETEALLEEILVKNPQLLLPGLRLVGRQTPVAGGALDLLGIDEDGRLVVFELKRGILAREAVAQILDYVSYLAAMDLDALALLIAKHSGRLGIEEIEDFQEWYRRGDFESLEGLRPLRMCLVGLGADEATERMTTFLAEDSNMYISLITFHCFERGGETLLARRVHVEGASTPERRPARRYLSVAERRDKLEKLVAESGVSELFTTVWERFRESWTRCTEYIGTGGIGFYLSEQTENGRRPRSYARIDLESGGIRIAFYRRAFGFLPHEFAQGKKGISFEEYSNSTDSTLDELWLLLDANGWETHQDRLTVLMRGVYQAWEGREEL